MSTGKKAGMGGLSGSMTKKKKYVHKEHDKAFPGDFKNFIESKEFKKAKTDALSTMKSADQHPVERKHAGFKFLMESGPNEQKAFKKYRKRTAKTRDEARVNVRKGGRASLKGGGRAYGKNS